MSGNIGPCQYPGCRDVDDNPRLTYDGICEPSRRHYRMVLDRIVLHYALLRRDLPKPVPPPGERIMRVAAKVFGHPAEWASDTCRDIADQLSEAHDALAEHLGHDGPVWHGHNEVRRVVLSYHYLTMWFDRLCSMPGTGDTAEALRDLDRGIRRGLGKTEPRRFLPVPCPRPECGLIGLVRTVWGEDEEDVRVDQVDCYNCGEVIQAERYGWWTRTLLNEHLHALDAPDAQAG